MRTYIVILVTRDKTAITRQEFIFISQRNVLQTVTNILGVYIDITGSSANVQQKSFIHKTFQKFPQRRHICKSKFRVSSRRDDYLS